MKIIIDIPEEVYERCRKFELHSGEAEVLEGAVATGTPLQETEVRCIDCEHLRTTLTQGKHLPGAFCASPIWKELGRAPHVVEHDLYEPILCDHFEKKEGTT